MRRGSDRPEVYPGQRVSVETGNGCRWRDAAPDRGSKQWRCLADGCPARLLLLGASKGVGDLEEGRDRAQNRKKLRDELSPSVQLPLPF